MELQLQYNRLKEDYKTLKNELKKYKLLRPSNNMINRLGVSRTPKFEHKQRIKKILSIIDTELRVCNFKFDSIVIKSSNSVEDNPFRLIFCLKQIEL